jgi:defect-in-organelle-trafficking protein DotA
MMRRLFTAIFLLLFASAACADDSGAITQAHAFSQGLVPPESDRSVAYLGQIFGTVGNVIQGSGGQILGKMFAVFNQGILVAAVLWLAVSTGQITLRAAAEGSAMGQNKNLHMVFLRIACGFSLLLPSSSTGYSLLQDLFMKVVVSSVALADQTWNAALNYLSYGGQLYIPPKNINNTTTTQILNSFIGTLPTGYGNASSGGVVTLAPLPGLAAQIFQNEVCMLRSSGELWNAGNKVPNTFTMFEDPANGTIFFPGYGNGETSSYTVTGHGQEASSNANCGFIQSYCASSTACGPSTQPGYTGSVNTGATYGGLDVNLMEWNYAWLAMRQLVISLMPAAQAYVNQYTSGGSNANGESYTHYKYPSTDPSTIVHDNGKTFFTAILAYGNLVNPLQSLLSGENRNLGKEAAHGWITAGGFYWDIEETNKASAALSLSTMLPNAIPPNLSNLPGAGAPNTLAAQELVTAADEVYGVSPYTGYSGEISSLWSTFTGTANSRDASKALNNFQGSGLAEEILFDIIMGPMAGGFAEVSQSDHTYNPISILMNQGDSMLSMVASMWTSALAISIILAFPMGVCNSTVPVGLVIKTLLGWVKGIIMFLSSLMLMPGAIFAYYVPLYPFAVFTFAVIGWVALMVEGMAAAPLVCLGMTHPDGHDFMGKAEGALMFFLGIFVRPALLIIGLIASMLVSYIAFNIFLSGYYHVMKSINTPWVAGLGELFMVLINWIIGVSVFSFFTMEIIEQSYRLTYQLPQYVMRWIGGPEMGQDYGGMAAGVKGAVEAGAGTAQKLAEGANKGVEQMGKDIAAIKEKSGKGANVVMQTVGGGGPAGALASAAGGVAGAAGGGPAGAAVAAAGGLAGVAGGGPAGAAVAAAGGLVGGAGGGQGGGLASAVGRLAGGAGQQGAQQGLNDANELLSDASLGGMAAGSGAGVGQTQGARRAGQQGNQQVFSQLPGAGMENPADLFSDASGGDSGGVANSAEAAFDAALGATSGGAAGAMSRREAAQQAYQDRLAQRRGTLETRRNNSSNPADSDDSDDA